MIKKLHIQGFKCFDNEEFTIAPLTLLAGLNSSGKSTFLQAIRLVYGRDNALAGLGPFSELVSSQILRRPEARSSAVRNNVSAWLSIISPGIRFEWESISKADLLRAEYSGHRPGNVGFGISYTLPVIANVLGYAALVARGYEKSALIMLENPEAHLHPAGQTQIGGFLAKAASCGVQVIIETHSDHLLNGIRLAVKNKFLEAEKTAYYFFDYDFSEEKSVIRQPVIDDEGYFDEWPDGFFDETEKNLERLL